MEVALDRGRFGLLIEEFFSVYTAPKAAAPIVKFKQQWALVIIDRSAGDRVSPVMSPPPGAEL